MRKLNLNFSYSFNGKIWNIISNNEGELLLLEVREHAKFQAMFYLLDLTSYSFILKDIAFNEPWWISASYMTKDVILFHVYDEHENPDSKEFFAYDFKAKRSLWTLKSKNLIEVNDRQLWLTSPGLDERECYDLKTGVILSEPVMENCSVKNKSHIEPFHYREGSPHFETVQKYIRSRTERNAIKAVDYYENDAYIIISYYFLTESQKLANDLLVIDHQGEEQLKVSLGHNLNGISDNTFFVNGNALIFVKNNMDFLIYQLD